MDEKMNIKFIGRKSIIYLIFFVVIFISDDTFTFGTNQDTSFILFKYLIYFVLTAFLFIKSDLRIFFKVTRANLVLVGIMMAVIFTAILNFDATGGYIYQIWLAILAYLITQYMSSEELVRAFVKFIYALSLISIVVYILASSFSDALNYFPVFINANDVEFYNLGICVVFKDVGQVRNTGIFREPGVFMIYLSIAIIFELFCNYQTNKRYLLVLIIALFLTFSTAAFIILTFIFTAYLFKRNTLGTVYNKILILILGIFVTVAIVLSPDIYSRVFDKVGKDSVNEGSSLARGASILVNSRIFLDNPAKGVGISNFPDSFSKYSLNLFGISLDSGNNTNTITTIFAIYGFGFGLIYIYLIIKLTKRISASFIIRALFILIFLMMFSNEDLRYSLMSAVLLFWGLRKTSFVEDSFDEDAEMYTTSGING